MGLKLPQPRKLVIEVEMDERQERKYVDGLESIERALEKGARAGPELLGHLMRLNSVALHADLDEGYDWETAWGGTGTRVVSARTLSFWEDRGWVPTKKQGKGDGVTVTRALPRPDPESAKIEAVANRVVANRECGHIIFCQPKAPHKWICAVLVDYGVPKERIAIINASTATAAQRQRIAEEFNGDPELGIEPVYDVVIANSVAYEGMDLQVRTCAVHHVDLPWTPADLEQRNGRAWRQGNTLGTLEIYYYISAGSLDKYRSAIISGKSSWLNEILRSDRPSVNNPAAAEIDFEEVLIDLSRNPEKTAKMVEERKRRIEEETRQKKAVEASRKLARASARLWSAREAVDPDKAEALRKEGEALLAELRRTDATVWPWGRWIDHAREVEFLVPSDGSAPVFEGLRVTRLEHTPTAFECGRVRISAASQVIGIREAGTAVFIERNESEVGKLEIAPEHMPGLTTVPWPEDDDAATESAIAQRLRWRLRDHPFHEFGWLSASDAFISRWPRFARQIAEGSPRQVTQTVPVVVDGALRLAQKQAVLEGEILPPNREGWHAFVSPRGGERSLRPSDLRAAARAWWDRALPERVRRDRTQRRRRR
ncbi:MAG: helicase-related protein [Nannocystaceae bacterium]